MNFYEQEKKEQDLRFEAWNKIEKALETLEQLENKNNQNINILAKQIEDLKATNMLKNLEKINISVKKTAEMATSQIDKTNKNIETFSDDIFYLLKKHTKIFLFYVPAIIITFVISIWLYYINFQIKEIKNTIQENTQNVEDMKNFYSNIEGILKGNKKYWYDKKNNTLFLKTMKNNS